MEDIAIEIPANARLASFLPFDAVLPKVDVLVTNGGYGTVSMALAKGIPLVVSGLSEDKAEVGARVAWSGAGINLASNAPSPEALSAAVTEVLEFDNFRSRAREMADKFSELDSAKEIFAIIDDLTSRKLGR